MLLTLACKNILAAQLEIDIKDWRGSLPPAEAVLLRPVKDYDERMKTWLKAAGGCQKYNELLKL